MLKKTLVVVLLLICTLMFSSCLKLGNRDAKLIGTWQGTLYKFTFLKNNEIFVNGAVSGRYRVTDDKHLEIILNNKKTVFPVRFIDDNTFVIEAKNAGDKIEVLMQRVKE